MTKRMEIIVLLGSITALTLVSSCTKPTVMDACRQYKRSRDCEAVVRRRMPTALDCEELTKRFEGQCSQQDIDYAFEAFKLDAEKMCSFKSVEEVDAFKPSFNRMKMSTRCNKLTE